MISLLKRNLLLVLLVIYHPCSEAWVCSNARLLVKTTKTATTPENRMIPTNSLSKTIMCPSQWSWARTTSSTYMGTVLLATTTESVPIPSRGEDHSENSKDGFDGGNDEEDEEEELTEEATTIFQQQCRALCQERNLPFTKIKNARDLSTVRNSPIRPRRILRMGRVSDATADDIHLLMREIGIQTLVDLRSPTELKDDPTLLREEVFQNFTNVVWKEQGRKKDGCLRELKPGEGPVRSRAFWKRLNRSPLNHNNKKKYTPKDVVDAALNDDPEQFIQLLELAGAQDDEDDDDDAPDCGYDALCGEEEDQDTVPYKLETYQGNRKERHFVSLMNEFKYVKGTVSKVRKRDIMKGILKSPGALLSRRVRSSIKKPFLAKINGGGLHMLNELMLRFGAPGIRYVLQLCADRSRHPIAFYCTAGKDRTGMLTALILALCGVKSSDIVEDYAMSANVYAEMNDHQAMVGALSQRNLDAKTFLGAPPEVMRDTLLAIENEYGSVEEYLTWIGFGPDDQQKLKDACMNE